MLRASEDVGSLRFADEHIRGWKQCVFLSCVSESLQICIYICTFVVGLKGVRLDFKVVSACLDSLKEITSVPQRVSYPIQLECQEADYRIQKPGHFNGAGRGGVMAVVTGVNRNASFTNFSASCCLWARSLAGKKLLSTSPPVWFYSRLSNLFPLAHVESRLCHRRRRRLPRRRRRGRRQHRGVRRGVPRQGMGRRKLGFRRLVPQRGGWRRRTLSVWVSHRPAGESFAAGAALEQLQALVALTPLTRTDLALPQHRLADPSPEVAGAAQAVRAVRGAQAGVPHLTWWHKRGRE